MTGGGGPYGRPGRNEAASEARPVYKNAAYAAFLAYVVISPFVAAAAFGTDTAFRVASALNLGLILGWSFGTRAIKFEISFPSAPKPIDVPTAFSVEGIEAVRKGYIAASESPFAPPCADPANCGSEFKSDSLTSRTVTCTRCGLKGELDAECVAELAAGAAIELPAGKAVSRG